MTDSKNTGFLDIGGHIVAIDFIVSIKPRYENAKPIANSTVLRNSSILSGNRPWPSIAMELLGKRAYVPSKRKQ